MPKIIINVPHQLGQQAAAERLQTLIAALKDRHEGQVTDLHEEWVDNALKFRFKTFGFQFQGSGTVSDTDAKLDIDIPFAAMMFKGKIESEIRETLTRKLRGRQPEA